MTKIGLLSAALLLGFAAPGLAQSACTAPIAPAAIDGTTATIDQVRAAVQDAKNFIAESDVYQNCLGKEVEDARAKANSDKVPFDESLAKAAASKADENQKLKEKVGAEANGAVAAYKKAHPSP